MSSVLLLSRLQFAFTISFHIIFPSLTIGLAAWLTVLEALHQATGCPTYRRLFEFWLKIFGVAFGLGVVSGIVMGFQFGTNWSALSKISGPIQGPLLTYETFSAFYLEASFFGVLLFGRSRVPPWFYLFSTAMVALGTTLSAFWIMANNSWMQVPLGYRLVSRTAAGLALIMILVFVYSIAGHLRVMSRWLDRPYLFLFPVIGIGASIVLARSVRQHGDRAAFLMAALGFAAAFGTFAITFWPYMIPFSVTVDQAAAPHASLAFMFWGAGLFILPLMLVYTAISYRVFRGKTDVAASEY